MGGNAFKALVPHGSFPRMPPPVYNALKAALFPPLKTLYSRVVVAREAPEKADYGDLDFVVSGPREGLTHAAVKDALRAAHSVPMAGPRISNYAIALDAFEDVAHACKHCEGPSEFAGGSTGNVYFQVDVNVCADNVQLERTVFYSSYGDLGLMLGLLVQTAGLSLGIYGLKLADPIGSPLQTFYLSDDTAKILTFLGLSMERWEQGFETQDEVVRWATSSPFARALAARLRSGESKLSLKERGEGRPMRQKFIDYLQAEGVPGTESDSGSEPNLSIFATPVDRADKIDAALRYFGKHDEYTAILDAARGSTRAKAMLNGNNVREWTGITGTPTRFILDEVKERLAARAGSATVSDAMAEAVPAWQRALLEMSNDEVRALTVSVKEDLDAAGKLEFDWRAAKAAKLERKKQQASAAEAEKGADGET
ncbi:hypothetical protein TRAPUB_9454 [Trametes pubescens]|uniref:Uncharacterized protein n=1 Tax=Trametes pubescens TaxID=154538 RepID=A0A1M2W2H5_TRAPU|nr:hypothetical protein TRAPUB_9454 [Trametes pubescens]